ncbi:MAG: 2-amino-4-hydroxy-6-hydroxymethyldihydropteridine diphosphokinase [Phocaeicola sp.]
MATVYIGLGSNLGQKESYLRSAVTKIEEQIGRVTSLSAFYVTEAWGYNSENNYLNAVCAVESEYTPLELLHTTQSIEKEMGRSSKTEQGLYSDRVIDIDILLYDDMVYQTPQLQIPHPLMEQRLFVLEPLAQIAPSILHPVLKQTVAQLLHHLLQDSPLPQ